MVSEVLGQDAAGLIDLTIRLQDHLGELHDVDVASGLLREFLSARIQQGEMASAPSLAAVFAYQTEVLAEIETRLRRFPELWRPIIDPSFRKVLARLVSHI